MRTQQHAEPETLKFRGATLDEAIEVAEQALGPRTRVIAANHIRRGGIGGFFASDLGVEVSVVIDDESIEEALDRIVEETAVQEREKWRDRHELATAEVQVEPAPSTFAAALRRVDDEIHDPKPAVAFAAEVVATPVLPIMPRPKLPAAAVPVVAVPPVVQPPVVQPPVVQPPVVPTVSLPASTTIGSRMERLEAAFASLRAGDPSVAAPVRPTAPSRRQVELVVAAADQLIESIARRGDIERLSVRVVLRGSTGAEVEAEANWATQDEVA